MLIRFNVGNFLSFNDIQEFSMLAGKVRSKTERVYSDDNIKLLKFAAVFGANASGKSNLVHAMEFAQNMIVSGFPKRSINQYFKLLPANKEKASYFEFEIKIGENYYSYGFEAILSKQSIISEWLYEIASSGQDKEIFTRDVIKGEFSTSKYFKDKELNNKLDIYANDIKTDKSILFLKSLNQNKDTLYSDIEEAKILRNIYYWFKSKFDINYPDRAISDYSYFSTNENIDQICSTISAFGTGITKYTLIETPIDKLDSDIPSDLFDEIIHSLITERNISIHGDSHYSVVLRALFNEFYIFEIGEDEKVICKTVQFYHGNDDVLFSLSEESDGTIRLLDLITVLFDTNKDRIFVIDEIDRCLHPQLTYKFISEFLKMAEKRNIQLIVTTHESRLLDFDLLRKDEIWFVDKNNKGESSIYSLDEYNERFDKKIDKAYLEGRYGGVPIFSTIFPIQEA